MGKSKKIKVSKTPKNQPLDHQMMKDEVVTESGRVKVRSRQADEDEDFVGGKLSKQILSEAKKQLQDIEEEASPKSARTKGATVLEPPKVKTPDSDEDVDDDSDSDDGDTATCADMDDVAKDLRIHSKDEAAFAAFMTGATRSLADIIKEKKTEIETTYTDAGSLQRRELDPDIVELCQGIGQVLKKYRSGKVPKFFKMIPQYRNWEELLCITQPDEWSAAAVFRATKIFTSGLKTNMAQRFFNQYLLPRVRDDINYYGRLNFHLFQAIRKALFKPGAFFKGFLIPLCEEGNCTLKEAIIIGSVLAKNSIAILHSCAAMIRIAELEYTGANSIFLRIFLDKKYALPYRVVDALVHHFVKFRREERALPVLWHQALLTFVQRYKNHISSEQRDALLDIARIHTHKFTHEIRRELTNAKCRDLEVEEPMEK